MQQQWLGAAVLHPKSSGRVLHVRSSAKRSLADVIVPLPESVHHAPSTSLDEMLGEYSALDEKEGNYSTLPDSEDFGPTEESVSPTSTLTPSVVVALERVKTTDSTESSLSTRVPSRGYVRFTTAELCHYIQATRSRFQATIVSIIRRREASGIPHTYLLVHIRGVRGKELWVRLDRRAHRNSNLEFASASFECIADDSAYVAKEQGLLLFGSPSLAEAEIIFQSPPSLEALRELLQAVCEEASVYKLWPENCWFFCSLIQEHFVTAHGGSFKSGELNDHNLARGVRDRVRARMHAPKEASHRSPHPEPPHYQLSYRLNHRDTDILSIAMSPDQKFIASGSVNCLVQIWQPPAESPLYILEGHSQCVTSVAISPDNELVFSGSGDHTVRAWSLSEGTPLFTFSGHKEAIMSVALSPDGLRGVSGSTDGVIHVWSADTASLIFSLNGHSHAVRSVAFSPDGERIISGSRDKTVRIWSSLDGGPLSTLEGHADRVCAVACSLDNRYIASASNDRTVRLWSSNGTLLVKLKHESPIKTIDFSPDGTMIASGSDDSIIRLWSTSAYNLLAKLHGHHRSVLSVLFSSSGREIISSGEDGGIQVLSSDPSRWRAPSRSNSFIHKLLHHHGE